MGNLDREIERLKKLRAEKNNYLAKAKVVMWSCIIIAGADDKVVKEENRQIIDRIFRRYCFPEYVEKYPDKFEPGCLLEIAIEKEIKEHSIGKDFLEDLYLELKKLIRIDGKVLDIERDRLEILSRIFKGDVDWDWKEVINL